MNDIEIIVNKNQQEWENNVQSGDQYTIPWLNIDNERLEKYVNCELSGFHKPFGKINNAILKNIRKLLYTNLTGKRVLCLASGGGQQSVIFSLLGADVTVADISQGQLNGDIQASNHYGYKIKTVICNMLDLSIFSNDYFDIVFQPVSICFVPDVFPVYKEVFRILKKGGLYEVGHINPSTYPVDFENDIDGWDGIGYRISSPYIGGALRIDDKGNENMNKGEMTGEFRHLFIDIFCKLTESGFQIKYVWEDERNLITDTIKQEEIVPKKISERNVYSVMQRYINILSSK